MHDMPYVWCCLLEENGIPGGSQVTFQVQAMHQKTTLHILALGHIPFRKQTSHWKWMLWFCHPFHSGPLLPPLAFIGSFHWLWCHHSLREDGQHHVNVAVPLPFQVGLGCPQPVCSNPVLCDPPGRWHGHRWVDANGRWVDQCGGKKHQIDQIQTSGATILATDGLDTYELTFFTLFESFWYLKCMKETTMASKARNRSSCQRRIAEG